MHSKNYEPFYKYHECYFKMFFTYLVMLKILLHHWKHKLTEEILGFTDDMGVPYFKVIRAYNLLGIKYQMYL